MTQQHDPAQSGGPYLQVACLCENVVQRADGVLTLVNILDRINITTQGTDAPEALPPTPWGVNLVIILKSGRARGRHELRVAVDAPDLSQRPPAIMALNFEGDDDRGVQVVQQIRMLLNTEGLYWFNILLADRLLTKVPLRVTYTRITGGVTQARG